MKGIEGSQASTSAYGRAVVERQDVYRLDDPAYATSMKALVASVEAALATHKAERGKTIIFCSSHRGEGKSTVVGALCAELADSGKFRVAVVDAGERQDAVDQYARGRAVKLNEYAAELLGSNNANGVKPGQTLFIRANVETLQAFYESGGKEAISSAFDWILIDTPALSDSAAALMFSKNADGVILVIEAGATRWPIVHNAKEKISRSGARILGAFLNKRTYYVPQRLYVSL